MFNNRVINKKKEFLKRGSSRLVVESNLLRKNYFFRYFIKSFPRFITTERNKISYNTPVRIFGLTI